MHSTTVALALLVAGAQAYPRMSMAKRASQGTAGPMGNSGYSATPPGGLKEKCLQAHNDGRKAYGRPALRWNDQLAESAQGWAQNIGSNMEHSGHDGYGENLAYNSNGDVRYMILSQWFDECPDYSGGFSEGAGHYTQCVWEGTTDVGCGLNGDNMLVCQYYPAGNMMGDFQNQVPSPGQCVTTADLAPGSGGDAPADAAPGYDSGNKAPTTPSAPTYNGGNKGPTKPSGPSYNGGGAGQAPAGGNGGHGNGGHGNGGHGNGGHGQGPKPQQPKPKPEEDCDEGQKSQKPTGGHRPPPPPPPQPVYKNQGGHGQGPSHGPGPHGGQGPAPGRGPRPQKPQEEDCDDEDQSPSKGGNHEPRPYGNGNQGQGPSHGGPSYVSSDSSDDSSSHGGYSSGGHGGSSGGHGGSSGGYGGDKGGSAGGDDDCEE